MDRPPAAGGAADSTPRAVGTAVALGVGARRAVTATAFFEVKNSL